MSSEIGQQRDAAFEHLVSVVQDLSLTRNIQSIAEIVRDSARFLLGSDGATFILRDGQQCHYIEENAISPLWKGKRFPMKQCVSGWVMNHAQQAIIPDIYQDERVPVEAYRPTFVKSMAMVPIRRESPIGAIGTYWASSYQPTESQMAILQSLADTTSVAIENVQLYSHLEKHVEALERSCMELSRFAWVASHDFQEPLRVIANYSQMLRTRHRDSLDAHGQQCMDFVLQGSQRIQSLITDFVTYSQVNYADRKLELVPLQICLADAMGRLHLCQQKTQADITYDHLPTVHGDLQLLTQLLQNLISNSLKFRKPGEPAAVQLRGTETADEWHVTISDNGIGFPQMYAEKIFGFFERLHPQDVYPGSGMGLAVARRIMTLHGGKIWANSAGNGSSFTLAFPKVLRVNGSE